ncbi:metalloregulator ArsR/SmtB family transcription factor [Candidatus Parcubacteria bacterium]|nr:metalloregulator ArsR/SmtB family transcription factor [Patescibacteria group bacterium]MBU4309313.1 metalloregulator ArsR/SmtB family transcription factor [Patescibacteria group bacterium]MBU4432290.1 metalloregulator ArsR/SmtB family transcription factor [Patescibacteria group bacterium]MBU4577674.1 metalloregulator ArsR/SmtB family transcription factor [Patescibacteria group bacterium]MCG2697360.1 metalloregulator ArsR/SmtB family transcription factor [Candidatus Parcubacteria bacterium]
MEFKCCTKNTTEEKEVSRVYDFLKIIADKNRLRILCILEDKPRCVSDIFADIGISQKLTSHHLGQMKKVGLVTEKREGNFIRYSVNKKVLKEYKLLFNKLIK